MLLLYTIGTILYVSVTFLLFPTILATDPVP